MADQYITEPIDTDPADIEEVGFEHLASVVPGWEPELTPGISNDETRMIETFARMISVLRDTAALVPRAIFRYLGKSLHGIPAIEDVESVGVVTITGTPGRIIPEQTTISMTKADGTLKGFETTEEVTISDGGTVDVSVIASEAGSDGNSSTAPVEMVDALEFVSSVEISEDPHDGSDAESDDEYEDRLSRELELLSPRPVVPRDFAILALRKGPWRSTAINGYNPDTDTYGNEKTISVASIDESGGAASSGVKTAVENYLKSLREINFDVFAIDAEYNALKFNFEITVDTLHFEEAEVLERAVAELMYRYSPAAHGLPDDGVGQSREWTNDDTIRYLDVATVLRNVDGVKTIPLLEIALVGDTFDIIDVTMNGAAPMPTTAEVDITGAIA